MPSVSTVRCAEYGWPLDDWPGAIRGDPWAGIRSRSEAKRTGDRIRLTAGSPLPRTL